MAETDLNKERTLVAYLKENFAKLDLSDLTNPGRVGLVAELAEKSGFDSAEAGRLASEFDFVVKGDRLVGGLLRPLMFDEQAARIHEAVLKNAPR